VSTSQVTALFVVPLKKMNKLSPNCDWLNSVGGIDVALLGIKSPVAGFTVIGGLFNAIKGVNVRRLPPRLLRSKEKENAWISGKLIAPLDTAAVVTLKDPVSGG
jgi:hypothetical protein